MAIHLSTRSHRARQISYLLLGALLSLVVVDCGLRIVEATPLWRVFPVVEPILGHPDREVGFDSTPGAKGVWPIEHRSFVRINSLGLRDVERQRAKPAGSLRVGLLGDSMVEATQVGQEATFGTLAERRLRAEGYNIELLNLAVAGPNPIRQLLRLEKRGYALNLDWVVAHSASASFVSGLLLDDSQNPAYVDAGDGRLVRGYAFRQRFVATLCRSSAGAFVRGALSALAAVPPAIPAHEEALAGAPGLARSPGNPAIRPDSSHIRIATPRWQC
jgi:hypothetical protein